MLEYDKGDEWLVKMKLSDNHVFYESYKGYEKPLGFANENLLTVKNSVKISNSRKNSFIGSLNEIVIVSEQVQGYLRNEMLRDPLSLQKMYIICLEYLASLSRILMESIAQVPSISSSYLMKSLANSNALSPVSYWKMYNNHDYEDDIRAGVNNSKLLPQILFENMKRNFVEFIDENNLITVFKNHRESRLGDLIFEISQTMICSLFLLKKNKEAFAILNSSKKCLSSFSIDGSLIYKFRLTWSAMKLEHEKNIRMDRVNKEITKARQGFEKLGDRSMLAECHLIQTLVLIKSKKSMRFADIDESFRIIRKLCESHKDSRLILARANLAYCKFAQSFNIGSEDMIEMLIFSAKIFCDLKLKALEGISLRVLGDLYYSTDSLVESEES